MVDDLWTKVGTESPDSLSTVHVGWFSTGYDPGSDPELANIRELFATLQTGLYAELADRASKVGLDSEQGC